MTRRVYVEIGGDPFYGRGAAEATVEVDADGSCELISGDVEWEDLDDVFHEARLLAGAA